MKKLALLLLLNIAVYGADSAVSKESNSGFEQCVKILKEAVPPLYANVAYQEVLNGKMIFNLYPEQTKPYCTALGLYLNLLVESPKPKAKK